MPKKNTENSFVCPKCGSSHKQVKSGFTPSHSQRVTCGSCKKSYTHNPKSHAFPQEVRELAIKEYYAGASGRGVGKIHNMDKTNVYRWISDAAKKN